MYQLEGVSSCLGSGILLTFCMREISIHKVASFVHSQRNSISRSLNPGLVCFSGTLNLLRFLSDQNLGSMLRQPSNSPNKG